MRNIKHKEPVFESIEFSLFSLLSRHITKSIGGNTELLGHEFQESVLSLSAQTFPVPFTCVTFILIVDNAFRCKLSCGMSSTEIDVDILEQFFVSFENGEFKVLAQYVEICDEGAESVDREDGDGATGVVTVEFASFFEVFLHVFEGDEGASATLLEMGCGMAHVGEGGTAEGEGLVGVGVKGWLMGRWGSQNGLWGWVLGYRNIETNSTLFARGARTESVGH